ncbi:MAG: DsrE family protein [Rhodospirillales bacterium]
MVYKLRNIFAALAMMAVALAAATPAMADTDDPLFINLTTDQDHRADMALGFSKAMLERGHPVTIWLNDSGVLLASTEQSGRLADQQKALAELMAKGATVIVCPACLKHYGVADGGLIAGTKLGNPDLTGGLLFKDDTKVLSW